MLANRLKKGDTIGIIAPSDPIEGEDLDKINKSIILMENAGFELKFGKYVFSNTLGYSATPKEKAQDLNNMFANKNVKAIICASRWI